MFIPYVGNKVAISNEIKSLLPSYISTYIEPFGGSFGLFFSIDINKYENTKFIYNDINYYNCNLIQMMKSEKFTSSLDNIYVDENKFIECLNKIKVENNKELIALYWLIIITCGDRNQEWIGNNKFKIFKLKINSYKNHLDKIYKIYNISYDEIIAKYDGIYSLFYLDPPYLNKENYYINSDFNRESHIKLYNILKDIKGKFILSYQKSDFIKNLYSDYKITSIKNNLCDEFLIMNF